MNIKKIKKKINNKREKRYLKSLRKRNHNLNPTIVSNNCIAGVIYHNLGLKFNSPTINLFIKGEEYLEFVKNFKYYSDCEIKEVEDNSAGYPVGKLIAKDKNHRDIHIYFQHYSSFSEAKSKWIERYSRVNWNNIYYIWEFYDTFYDIKLMYNFDKLELDNKIILSHKKYDGLMNCCEITCYTNDKPIAQILSYKGISGKRYLEEFDYVEFLNKKDK